MSALQDAQCHVKALLQSILLDSSNDAFRIPSQLSISYCRDILIERSYINV